MDDQTLLERLIETEEQCKKIKSSLNSIQLYLNIQLIIVISYISLPWYYEYQKASIFYLICRLLQYSFHLFSVIQIKQTVEIISESSRQFIESLNDQIDVWAAVKGNHGTLSKCNQFVYIIMFGLGNVVLLQNTLLLSKWILVVQLIFGWVVLATIVLGLFAICLILPFLLYRVYRQRLEEERRRQEQALRLIGTQFKYSELNGQTFQPCYICLQNYDQDDLIVKLSCNPNHIFHSDCIRPWAEINDTCPVCRQRLSQQ
ncbi:unnamed protein product (macronuclear) [Paramecium tetraurelia]|uniref:RING-type domain-containing protein n=1 Tax=Paramecium tetraurelia TaxID=5888 RepID=A0DVH0_PARTE|nr:uncharacterized protein GSPATT00020690001 [Paramecium tetraurelia]CAK87037.1 unnamed protein product [Paramecium tetraurelia]|eukprot:XP_001454434.1 hypothetical protein (macronuclear) [Paramecium tetraurelia strain d4-2]